MGQSLVECGCDSRSKRKRWPACSTPHFVQLHEVGEVHGQPFYSLEFCDGGTLTEQLKMPRPSPQEAAALIEMLARAMHFAHLRGVVHRDLKPGNVPKGKALNRPTRVGTGLMPPRT